MSDSVLNRHVRRKRTLAKKGRVKLRVSSIWRKADGRRPHRREVRFPNSGPPSVRRRFFPALGSRSSPGLAQTLPEPAPRSSSRSSLRGAYDHLRSNEIFADLDVVRQTGAMMTTPSVARLRADVLLFIGDDLTAIWPQLIERPCARRKPGARSRAEPAKAHLDRAPRKAQRSKGSPSRGWRRRTWQATLAALRARVAGRRSPPPRQRQAKTRRRRSDPEQRAIRRRGLGAAKLDRLSVEDGDGPYHRSQQGDALLEPSARDAAIMPPALCRRLAGRRAFACEPRSGAAFPNMTHGGSPPTGWWMGGEADAALWISAYSAATPSWKRDIPLVALVPAVTQFSKEAASARRRRMPRRRS